MALALEVMGGEVARGPLMSSEADTARCLRLKAGRRRREVFGCLFLTTMHCLIRDEELFYGSIDRATVHPRVILQKALAYNAAAVIAYHNHPSGVEEPSLSDMSLTSRTKDLLQEIEVWLLDHIVVSRTGTVSMAARGLIRRTAGPERLIDPHPRLRPLRGRGWPGSRT